jgi:hypothetical protein
LVVANKDGVPTDFATSSHQKPNNRADNRYRSHTWVQNLMATPWQGISLTSKLKSEVISRLGNSTYNRDVPPSGSLAGEPDGIINGSDVSLTEAKAVRWGEGLGFRFARIPRTALYSEVEFEQVRMLTREDRQSLDGPDTGVSGVSDGEIFNRETVTKMRRGAFTLGGRTSPWAFLDVTAHVRHRINNNDYDDQRESDASASGARSAFVDAQNIHTNEFGGRVTWKPCRAFRPSFRYKLRGDKYDTRIESQQAVKTNMVSHVYTYDVTMQPWQPLLATVSFSRENAFTVTPARLLPTTVTSGYTPGFNADVNSWLLSLEYLPPKVPVVLTNSLLYSRARNFNDVSNTGLPLGADFARLDLTTGLQWSLNDRTTLSTEYAYYHYNGNDNVDFGGYNAHLISLETRITF